jgi:hypothetical protein
LGVSTKGKNLELLNKEGTEGAARVHKGEAAAALTSK